MVIIQGFLGIELQREMDAQSRRFLTLEFKRIRNELKSKSALKLRLFNERVMAINSVLMEAALQTLSRRNS